MFLIKWSIGVIHAKNYENIPKFVKAVYIASYTLQINLHKKIPCISHQSIQIKKYFAENQKKSHREHMHIGRRPTRMP